MRARTPIHHRGASRPVSAASLAVLLCCLAAARADPATGVIAGSVPALAGTLPWVVYIEYVQDAPPPPREHLRIEQQDSQFRPDVVVAMQGQELDFANLDKHYHNVFSNTPGSEFDLGLYRGGQSRSLVLRKSGEIAVYCNIHETMTAKLLVLQNPHFARAAPDGTYRIAGVAPGSYTLVAWSPRQKPERLKVAVRAGAVTTADFHLKRPRTEEAHTDKTGAHYGRYR